MTEISDPVVGALALLTGGCAIFVCLCAVANCVEHYLARREERRLK